MSIKPLLRVTDLHRHFGRLHAVCGLSFTVQRGEAVGLLGVNGAGKSTTLRMLAGVLAASSGHIEIDGTPLGGHGRKLIGYLPEHPPLYPELSVDEYLTYCARLRGAKPATAVPSACERCGLNDVRRGTAPGPVAPKASRLSASKFHCPPTGLSPLPSSCISTR